MKIIIDTREQKPLKFRQHVRTEVRGLDVGDYALADDCVENDGRTTLAPKYAIERKSVADFIGSFFNATNSAREKAKRKLAERRGFKLPYVVCGDMAKIKAYNYSRFRSGNMNCDVVLAVISELRLYGYHVILCRSAQDAARQVESLLKRRAEFLAKKSVDARWAN